MTFIRKFLELLNMDNWNCNKSLNSNFEDLQEIDLDNDTFSDFADSYVPTSILPITENQISDLHIDLEEDLLEESKIETEETPYKSNKLIINGCNLFFIDIAREIVENHTISKIPLMREYNLSETELNDILNEIFTAGIIDRDYNVLMETNDLEKYIDIYEPDLFTCHNTVFDKEIFMCIGEIFYSENFENVYNSMPADEVLEYLNIMEKLDIIKYNNTNNQYEILKNYKEFIEICKYIPDSFSSVVFKECNITNNNYDKMTGIEFENYIANLLLKNNFINVKITPPSGDHGIDILAEKSDITYAIQCKCYSSNVGNAAVQQAHTGKSLYKCDVAVVLTNQYFTQQAKEEAQMLGVKLWDRDKLNLLIGE